MRTSLPIVLIGPMAAGKSTLAGELAKSLDLRQVPLDGVRYYYYFKAGMRLQDQLDQPDFAAVCRFWKPYEIEAAEQVVHDFADCVIDFGAGQAHYTDPARIARLERAFAPLPNVFLLLPSADPDRAEAICRAREVARLGPGIDPTRAAMVPTFVRSACFRRVAKHTVITGDRPIADSLTDILDRLET